MPESGKVVKNILESVSRLFQEVHNMQSSFQARILSLEQTIALVVRGNNHKKMLDEGRLNDLEQGLAATTEFILDLTQDLQRQRYEHNPQSLSEVLQHVGTPIVAGSSNKRWVANRNAHLPLLFGVSALYAPGEGPVEQANIFYLWGYGGASQHRLKILAAARGKPLFLIEDGFLKSILTRGIDADPRFHSGVCFTVDDLAFHFDATRPSRLECMLNSSSLSVSPEEKQRARELIGKIVRNKLTKYNHQPFEVPQIGRPGCKKVLVIDQAYNDYSIIKGMANDQTFADMLQSAITENPEADILVKTHPDTLAASGRQESYFTKIRQQGNVFPITFPCNPYSLLEMVDCVYVVSSQLGFEALLAGKEVHVFGLPFYAGWGATRDRQKTARRTRTRTVEEIFYITYVLYSIYVHPERKARCSIEDAIDYLLDLREEYYHETPQVLPTRV